MSAAAAASQPGYDLSTCSSAFKTARSARAYGTLAAIGHLRRTWFGQASRLDAVSHDHPQPRPAAFAGHLPAQQGAIVEQAVVRRRAAPLALRLHAVDILQLHEAGLGLVPDLLGNEA